MEKKHVAIIGAGPGGLTAGMILARRGFKVTVLEKEGVVGGRNAHITSNGFKFDIGPTFLMMEFILKEMFSEAGREAEDYLKFIKLDPMYNLIFRDFTLEMSNDKEKLALQIEKIFPGGKTGLEKFFKREKVRFESMYPCIQTDYSSIFSHFKPEFIKALPHLSLGFSMFDVLGNYFKDDRLKICFTFQSKYLGMSPWDCPGAFMMIPYIEHSFGVNHILGGLSSISEAMAEVIKEEGGTVITNSKVKKILVESGKAKGVELESGEKILADDVVVNADFGYAATQLFGQGVLKKYRAEKVKNMKYSCSTFMLYIGLKKKYELPFHNIVFSRDYKVFIEDIFKNKIISDEISYYIRNASLIDNTLAPEGKSAVYVLVPVPNNTSGLDWDVQKESFKEKVIDSIVERTLMKDIRSQIETLEIITPKDWESKYNVYNGATFNLSHTLDQMLYTRPHNKFQDVNNCYLVGGGTHPGSGLPTIYESARISSNLICDRHKIKYQKPARLP